MDPVILPSSNNMQSVSIGMLRSAFPAMEWNQPRTNRRAMVVTSKYMTINFAVEFGGYISCNAEKGVMLDEEFFEEAKAPPPLYFLTDERYFQGVCCVCYKKGVLGRCPNPDCGLLMHHTCVMSS